ncbi:MAG: IcmP, partial [uncultured bacterium]
MAAPQQQSQQDNSSAILWGVAAIFAAVGGIWYTFKTYIVTGFLMLKLVEVNLLNAVSNNHFEPIRNLILTALANPSKIQYTDLIHIGNSVGETLRYPFVLLLFVLAVLVYSSNSVRIFKRTYKMKELAKLEVGNWPQITPVVDLDLLKTDIDKGPWAMALQPMQFCKRYKLLEEVRPTRREGMSRKEWDKIEVILKRGEANRIFALQLGQLWKGTDKLTPYARALFAVFAARINADSKVAADMLAQLSASC